MMAISFPANPNENDSFTSNGKTWVWSGGRWKIVGTSNRGLSLEISDAAPSNPVQGDMWYESDSGRTYTYYDNVWIELGNTSAVYSFIADDDSDTLIQVEESADEDVIRFDTAGVERFRLTNDGHIIPSDNETYDLGSSSNRFRDLYLSGNSIDLGGATISSDGSSIAMPPVSNINGDFTVGTNVFHVDHANSSVGINTATPSYSLDVDGDISASGDILANGVSLATTGKAIAMAIVFGG